MTRSDKLPAMPFYTGDWRKDPAVQALGYFERGVWFELLTIMWESEPRGKLMLNGRPMPEEALARLLGLDNQTVNQTLTTLLEYGVASVEPDTGVIYSRRMVRDEQIRMVRKEAGKKGGNPNLVNQSSKQTPTIRDKQNPTLSVSSSVSSSEEVISTATAVEGGEDTPPPSDSTDDRRDDKDNQSGSTAIPPCPHQRLIELYHEILPMCPRVRVWHETRQGLLRARWRDQPDLDYWRRFFGYVAQSDFLTGNSEPSKGRPPFVADLEWIIRPVNYSKIVEGRYHQDKAA